MKIKILKDNIDISEIKKEIDRYPNIWLVDKSRQQMSYPQKNTQTIKLVTGVTYDDDPWSTINSEKSIETPFYKLYKNTIQILKDFFPIGLERIYIVKLLPNEEVYPHIDEGTYYLTRNRYHLSITGSYKYFVEDETIDVIPGMLFWFNNKLQHSSKNLKNEDRISIIFDVKDE